MAKFYDYFASFVEQDDLVKIANAEIISLKIRRESRFVEIGLLCDYLLDNNEIDSVQKSIAKNMNLKKAVLKNTLCLLQANSSQPISIDF